MKTKFSVLFCVFSLVLALPGCGDSTTEESAAPQDTRPLTKAQNPDKVVDPLNPEFDLSKFRFEDYPEKESFIGAMTTLCEDVPSVKDMESALVEIAGATEFERFEQQSAMKVIERQRRDAYAVAGVAEPQFLAFEYRGEGMKRGLEVDADASGKILYCNAFHKAGEPPVVVKDTLESKLGR